MTASSSSSSNTILRSNIRRLYFDVFWWGVLAGSTIAFLGVYATRLGASAIGGSTWALASAGLLNRLMERVPPDDLPAHMALHNLALNLGTLGGALIGPVLANVIGLRPALWLAAGLRVFSGALFGLFG